MTERSSAGDHGDNSKDAREVRAATERHDDDRVYVADLAHVERLEGDAQTEEWIERSRASMTDGSFLRDVEAQPDALTVVERLMAQRDGQPEETA